MNMIILIPHSAEAVNNLVALEREHKGISAETYRNRRPFKYLKNEVTTHIYLMKNNICQMCSDSISDISKIFSYPCPTLVRARAMASPATLIAVALRLGGSDG